MNKICCAVVMIMGLALCGRPALAGLVLSEVFYDAVGSDGGSTFVELYGTPEMELAGYALEAVNGSNGAIYKTVDLSGSLSADGILVLWEDLQNGPDSVRIVSGGLVVDALGYGDFNGAIFAGEGEPVPSVAAGSSLARVFDSQGPVDTDQNKDDFVALAAPTPGNVPAVPLPGGAWLLGSGLLGLIGIRRRNGGRL